MQRMTIERLLQVLERAYGASDWWPGENPFEIAVGAILTQRTSWRNVEIAINNLKSLGLMSSEAMHSAPRSTLESAVRPSGFYRQKAAYLSSFSAFLSERYNGQLENLGRRTTDSARKMLLSLPGIGPETADSILLYALQKPSFVVDAYTFRLLNRLGISTDESYDELKLRFEEALEMKVDQMSRMHALIVVHCKTRCRAIPDCGSCPLGWECPSNQK